MYRTERKKSIVNHRYESGGCYQITHQSIDENNKNNRSFNEIKMKSIVSAEKNIPSRFRSSNIFRMAKVIKGKPKNVIVEMGDALVSEAGISTDNLGPCLSILLDFMRGNTPMCYIFTTMTVNYQIWMCHYRNYSTNVWQFYAGV